MRARARFIRSQIKFVGFCRVQFLQAYFICIRDIMSDDERSQIADGVVFGCSTDFGVLSVRKKTLLATYTFNESREKESARVTTKYKEE